MNRTKFLLLLATAIPLLLSARNPETKLTFASVDQIMNEAVTSGAIPGGVVMIGHGGKVVYRKAFGWRVAPAKEPMTPDTIFDLASLTKCVATAPAVMKLVEAGKIRLNDPVVAYLPEFGNHGKENITIRQLLTHFSGLPPDLDLTPPWEGHEAAFRLVMQAEPRHPPGARFEYSDINFEALGFAVESVSGMPLNEYSSRNIFIPLKMNHTGFTPSPGWRTRIAPTESEQGTLLRGIVHDPTARRMGGIAGHAGLFSTADDLARFAQEMLSGTTILTRLSVEKMTAPQQPATATVLRGLGWDIESPLSGNRGELLPVGSFGHSGFTGTSLWIDPVTDTYIIILTNAVHPHGNDSVVSLRARIANTVASILGVDVGGAAKLRLARITGYNESMNGARLIHSRNGDVRNGIDVLEKHNFAELGPNPSHPVKVGLVTNQTGIDAQDRRTIDVLAQAPGVELAVIFTPEHGISGGEHGAATDTGTGVPIVSVYGNTDAQRRPSAESIAALDAIVYDIQDLGVRFYTYETTLGYFLEAAARAGKPIFVLDRPNPLGGAFVQGPVSDAGHQSFVNYGEVPLRHGLTIGELARLYNQERGINAALTVAPMQGWQRGDWFDSTGAMWVNPSPNMRSLTAAMLYPGVALIEGANVSVGRGTDRPFELLGAPWIGASKLAHYLNAREISGIRFVPVEFTPDADHYAGEKCGGMNLIVIDRNALDVAELGIELASALHTLYPDQFQIDKLNWLLANQETADGIRSGEDPRRVAEGWRDRLEDFARIRAKYLLY